MRGKVTAVLTCWHVAQGVPVSALTGYAILWQLIRGLLCLLMARMAAACWWLMVTIIGLSLMAL